MKPAKKCLVFDLDGTISDPSLGIARCYNHALVQFGYEAVEHEAILPLIGPPLEIGFKQLLPPAEDEEILRLIACYRERYTSEGFSENRLYPGIEAALDSLKEHKIRMGICTSKRVDFANRILNLFNLSNYFDFVSGGDVGISKSTQLADLLSHGSIDENAIMIGDRDIDINSARDNKLGGIGVLWGFGDYQELADAKPLKILRTTDELETLAD